MSGDARFIPPQVLKSMVTAVLQEGVRRCQGFVGMIATSSVTSEVAHVMRGIIEDACKRGNLPDLFLTDFRVSTRIENFRHLHISLSPVTEKAVTVFKAMMAVDDTCRACGEKHEPACF